ncbi:MAG TPA: M1 family metallopeptidase [Gemmatimonadaceae bacterium]|nr:M1 family metallopeptidase [Gemmatimonadaceae bacterium]
MTNPAVAVLLAVMQQVPTGTGLSSPPSGDTTGYWQQSVHYEIIATLDERARRVQSRGTLRYTNNSPDTLREMYFHQYLNAFRPASKWSEVDAREGRVRFQNLEDPDYGYERFTAPVRVNGVTVIPTYPGAPDSTVARIALPQPLAPGGSLTIAFDWDARPSTLPRRQGRRGRHWDLAQWYPKVAVYDRGGWEHNALQPAGEFYGEYGTYDVTLVVNEDQVLAATGVPVAGDPGWGRVRRAGIERRAANAYGGPSSPTVATPAGMKAVQFVAENVHHFAWSAAPEFIYEGGAYVRTAADRRFQTWDTVSIHVLYRPGDDTTWGGQRVVNRTIAAMQWLERIYGPYAYPQMTVVHRLDGGGTEFPMMQQNGSPSLGLILHEGGHVWSYGILGNSEWRSGWMDEGLTSYQTAWAQQLTPQERFRAGTLDRFAPVSGYRARGLRMRLPRFESLNLGMAIADMQGEAEPIGTIAHEFRDFGTYNGMIYNRGEVMFGQLRDAVGDTAFLGFLQDYYARWAHRHVDERAMRGSAERASGKELDWFFDQWVHRTGLTDYRLGDIRTTRDGAQWVTEATIIRHGGYQHPMSVGVRTSSGWTFGRMTQAPYERETLRIHTTAEPLEVRLDPMHTSWDWDRRNDIRRSSNPLRATRARVNFDWPFLDQADRERDVVLFRPMVWYSEPGGIAAGLRERGNYLGVVDRTEGGIVYLPDPKVDDLDFLDQLQAWWKFENPYLPFMKRPATGLHGSIANLDGVLRADFGRTTEYSAGTLTRTREIVLTASHVTEQMLAPELFDAEQTIDILARVRRQRVASARRYTIVEASAIAGMAGHNQAYTRGELIAGAMASPTAETRLGLRVYLTAGSGPGQRAALFSAEDPLTTFWNHAWRPRGGLLKRPGVNWLPLGGGGMRGFAYGTGSNTFAALNTDGSTRLFGIPRSRTLAVWGHAFGDIGTGNVGPDQFIADAGVGASLRGRLYDRDIVVRIDSPLYVSDPFLAVGRERRDEIAPRWVITFKDLW